MPRDRRKFDVVVVSTEPPDPFGTATGRWYYVLAKGLSERGHRVRWFAAYSHHASAARARARLEHPNLELRLYPYPSRSWLAGKWDTLRRPYGYFISAPLAHDLRQALRCGYDVLHLEPTWAGYLGMTHARAFVSVHALALVDLAGVRGSPRLLLTKALMKRAEREIISRFDTIRVLTSRDRKIVQDLNPRARISTIPVAIDPTLYTFGLAEQQQPTIGLIGSMEWQPTRSAAIRLLSSIWPRVMAKMQDAKLLVVGWGARRSLAEFLGRPDIAIIEDVPQAEPYFRRLSVLAFPVVNGSGMKVKVLEAMAYGVPVVTTSDGIAGIEAVDAVHGFISDDDDVMAARIIDLLRDKEMRHQMRLAARHLIERRHSPGPALTQVEDLYEEIARSGV